MRKKRLRSHLFQVNSCWVLGLASGSGSALLQCPGSFQGTAARGCLSAPSQFRVCGSPALGLTLQEEQNHQARACRDISSHSPGWPRNLAEGIHPNNPWCRTEMEDSKKKQTAQNLHLGLPKWKSSEAVSNESWSEDSYRQAGKPQSWIAEDQLTHRRPGVGDA